MGRLILASFLVLLVGCGADPIRITTEVKETFVPLLYSPAPPVIERPTLPIHSMTNTELKNDGTVVKYYKATIKTLIGYSKELEASLAMYDKINKAYKSEENALRLKFGELPNKQLEK